MSTAHEPNSEATALDVLEDEDTTLRLLFERLDENRGPDVEQRAKYGDIAKQLIRHVATREAALREVMIGMSGVSALADIVDRMDMNTEDRRELIDQAERMSRGIQGINLNQGQDFDSVVMALANLMVSEIEWELANAIPTIRQNTSSVSRTDALPSATHTRKHAPTNLSPAGPRWYERAPVVSRLITIYDHMRDFPRASRGSRR